MNKDVKTRDEIIFGSYSEKSYGGGYRSFKKLSLAKLDELVAKDFIDLKDRQNSCPSVKEIMAFIRKYPDYAAHGYAITIDRGDYRVSLEGVVKDSSASSMEELKDFVDMFRFADVFDTDGRMYCWFD